MGNGGSVPEVTKAFSFNPDFDEPFFKFSDDFWRDCLDICVLNVVRIVTPILLAEAGDALHSVSKLYGDRYARHNIRMYNLLPGFCVNVTLADRPSKETPAHRPATFAEIVQALVFLASEGARCINGQNVLSHGGMNRAVR